MAAQLKVLPAFNGDSMIFTVFKELEVFNILIDGGVPRNYIRFLKDELLKIYNAGQNIDLLIITHIDDDHIGGVVKMFEDPEIDKSRLGNIWFNSGIIINEYFEQPPDTSREIVLIGLDIVSMSINQGKTLECLLKEHKGWEKNLIIAGATYKFPFISLMILSPDDKTLRTLNENWEVEKDEEVKMAKNVHSDFGKPIADLIGLDFVEDTSVPNGSSIAFLVKTTDTSILFLGDSHPSIVIESLKAAKYSILNKLKVDLVKISHHASSRNTSDELLDLIECSRFLVCTDGSRHGLPNKEPLARIISKFSGCTIYFNYRNAVTSSIFSQEDLKSHNFNCIYLNEHNYLIHF